MNDTKNKHGLMGTGGPDQQLDCYRVWMKLKATKKTERRNHMLLGPYPLGTKLTAAR